MIRQAAIGLLLVAVGSACGGVKGERVLVSESGVSFGVDEVSPVTTDAPTSAPATPATSATAAATVVVEAERPVPAAFAFSATTMEGTTVSGDELFAGPLVMTFVRANCEYSEREAPRVADAAQRHPDTTFVVVASGPDLAEATWITSLSGAGENVVVIDDEDERLWRRFAVTASPSSVLVDVDGLMRTSFGELGESGLDRAAALLADGFAASA